MQRLHLSRITLEAIRIERAHLFDQSLYLSAGFGAILNSRFHLIQHAQILIDFVLRIGWSRSLRRSDRLTLDVGIAGIPAAEVSTLPLAAAWIADGTRRAIANALRIAAVLAAGTVLVAHAGLTSAALSTLLATLTALAILGLLLPALTLALAALSLLTTLALLALLSLTLALTAQSAVLLTLTLPLTLPLALPLLRTRTTSQSANLIAQTRQIVHRAIELSILCVGGLRLTHGARRVAQLLVELLQIGRQTGLSRIGEIAAAQPVRAALHARVEIVLIHRVERAPQFLGRIRLRRRDFARRVPHLLGEMLQVFRHLLALVHHAVDFLRRRIRRILARLACRVHLRKQIANVIRLLLLCVRELAGFVRHGTDAAAGVLLLRFAQRIGRFAQTIRRTPRIRRVGCSRSRCAPHIFIRLTETIERLLFGLLAIHRSRIRGLLRANAFILTGLSRLSGLSRLATLPALT